MITMLNYVRFPLPYFSPEQGGNAGNNTAGSAPSAMSQNYDIARFRMPVEGGSDAELLKVTPRTKLINTPIVLIQAQGAIVGEGRPDLANLAEAQYEITCFNPSFLSESSSDPKAVADRWKLALSNADRYEAELAGFLRSQGAQAQGLIAVSNTITTLSKNLPALDAKNLEAVVVLAPTFGLAQRCLLDPLLKDADTKFRHEWREYGHNLAKLGRPALMVLAEADFIIDRSAAVAAIQELRQHISVTVLKIPGKHNINRSNDNPNIEGMYRFISAFIRDPNNFSVQADIVSKTPGFTLVRPDVSLDYPELT